ncbi:MAG: hypothetical protein EPN93_05835 [Spirochaetes bacterium]|nr:MAG: hypothetical protein EPN93_05835 [Spirochaetota bacterium]
MKEKRWYIFLSLSLVIASSLTYLAQHVIFGRPEDTFFYMMQDLAFVPIQALLVMLIIDRLLQRKEKEALLHKMNMVVGVFFNEMGRELIALIVDASADAGALRADLCVSGEWDAAMFVRAAGGIDRRRYELIVDGGSLQGMRDFLKTKREMVLRLLENPNLLEHDTFTDLLWAVCHLSDELMHRDSLAVLPQNDIDHLKGDITRAFRLLLKEWLVYMKHLQKSYPYLFSLAVRMNPFNVNVNPVIT